MFKYLGYIGFAAADLAGGAIDLKEGWFYRYNLGDVTQAGITEAKTLAVPYIFKAIHEIDVKEVDFDGGYLKNIHVTIN